MTREVNNTMSVITSGLRRCRLLAAATGLALLAVVPAAHAAGVATNPLGCTPKPALMKAFAPWADGGDYTLAPGGNFETALSGWMLGSGAHVVAGNEPFYVGTANDHASLALPAGSSAISAPICIDDTYPWFRLFARNTGDPKSTLKVDVLYLDAKGNLKARASGDYTASSTAWTPTGTMKIDLAFDPTSVGGAAPVAFRFTPQGKGGNWQIDDVYVDPYRRF
jgi:hypothetical protein